MALVARVFSLKIRCSRSMNLSTSHIAMSDRKSCKRRKRTNHQQITQQKEHNKSFPPALGVGAHLGLPCALQYVHQCARHLLFALDTQHGLQHGAHGAVVVGDVLSKLLVQLYGQDVHGLEAGFEAKRCIDDLAATHAGALGEHAGLDDRVPLFHKLPAGDAGDGDADQAQVRALLLEGEIVGVNIKHLLKSCAKAEITYFIKEAPLLLKLSEQFPRSLSILLLDGCTLRLEPPRGQRRPAMLVG